MSYEQYESISLPDLRRLLAEAKVQLRLVEYQHKVWRAQTEADLVERAGGEKNLGTNAESREREFILHLDREPDYQSVRRDLVATQDEVDRLTAEIEGRLDERRERQLAVQDKTADAYLALAMKNGSEPAAEIAAELVGVSHA